MRGSRSGRAARRVLLALVAGLAVASPGLLPLLDAQARPLALVAWLALCAPAAGWAAGSLGLRPLPDGLAAPAVWAVLLDLLDRSAPRGEGASSWCALAVGGLWLLGLSLGSRAPERPWQGAGALLLAAAALVGAAGQGGLASAPLARSAPRLARVLFELSPMTLAMETAGVDWMRRPAVYEQAGTDWIGGERRPYRAPLAAGVPFVVGCLAAGLLRSRRRSLPSP